MTTTTMTKISFGPYKLCDGTIVLVTGLITHQSKLVRSRRKNGSDKIVTKALPPEKQQVIYRDIMKVSHDDYRMISLQSFLDKMTFINNKAEPVFKME